MKKLKPAIFLIFAFYIYGCEKQIPISPPLRPTPVYFSKSRQADFDIEPWAEAYVFKNQSNGLSAVLKTSTGFFQKMSIDTGLTWSNAKKIGEFEESSMPVLVDDKLIGIQDYKKVKNGGQIYYYRKIQEGWSSAAEIRDTNWGTFSLANFAAGKNGTIFCNWIDNRNGNSDLYFSSSKDSGRTWNANIRINDDQSGQDQNYSFLLAAEDGTLYAFWDDNRSPKTLYDIYCSASRDGGLTWSDNVKINDDTLHVWQRNPHAVCDKKGNIYVVWYDYRDKGIHSDIIANIYFSRSTDGGKTWSKNIRISNTKADHCLYPRLTLSSDNSLHCLYGSYDSKHRSDIFYSYSLNGGLSWSRAAKVNDNQKRRPIDYQGAGVFIFDKEDVYVGWYSRDANNNRFFLSKRILYTDSNRAHEPVLLGRHTEELNVNELNYSTKRLVFSDDFKNQISGRWQEISGLWVWKDESYIGYSAAKSLIKNSVLKDFEFSGRFMLDPLNHQAAYIFVRCEKRSGDRWSYYRILNFFRIGVNIDYFDGEYSQQITQIAHPFRENIWYKFQAIMKGEQLNYFINDSLILSLDKLSKNHEGLMGIGSGTPPTYFKDIRVYEIE